MNLLQGGVSTRMNCFTLLMEAASSTETSKVKKKYKYPEDHRLIITRLEKKV